MRIIHCLAAVLSAAVIFSDVHADGVRASTAETEQTQQAKQRSSAPGFTQTGRASFYHKSLRGLKTANGERYDPNAMTAAHRRLKLGTYVRVTHLRNKRMAIVKINDRLPPHGRAIIDLSALAARKLGMLRAGIARVRIEALSATEVEELLAEQ